MSGYPHHHNPPSHGYGYGPPPSQPYSAPPPSQPYSAPPPAQPYSAAPPSQPYSAAPYGGSPPPYGTHYGAPQPSAPYAPPSEHKPPEYHSSAPYGAPPPGPAHASSDYPPYGSTFSSLDSSAFPPGTDPNLVACFQIADQDGSGFIDDKELQMALSSYNQSFNLRTVHLLTYHFTNSNSRKIGPKEFTAVFYSLQNWRAIFEKFDRDRSGKIDASELKDALLSLGFAVSPVVLDLLVSKFDNTGGKNKAIEYGNFIECCLTVKGLTEKFKEKDTNYSGSATFTYESFMLTVLPFLVA